MTTHWHAMVFQVCPQKVKPHINSSLHYKPHLSALVTGWFKRPVLWSSDVCCVVSLEELLSNSQFALDLRCIDGHVTSLWYRLIYSLHIYIWCNICKPLHWDLYCNLYVINNDSTVKCHYNAVQYKIFHTALHWLKQNINQCQIKNYTPYLALMGELWGAFCENSIENWPHNNGTALYQP